MGTGVPSVPLAVEAVGVVEDLVKGGDFSTEGLLYFDKLSTGSEPQDRRHPLIVKNVEILHKTGCKSKSRYLSECARVVLRLRSV